MSYQTVHTPETLVKNVKMLPPGHFLQVKNERVNILPFWESASAIQNTELITDRAKATKEIRLKLTQAVERQMVCDVPFGAFLSGGIDSSILVGLMREVTDGAIDTFNISFSEGEFDESPYARQVADKFKTRHHEIKLTPQYFLDKLPEALASMDHPSCDGVNTYVVAGATKNAGVTMALSGLGGDELFGGYSIFKQSQKLQRLSFLNYVPRPLRQMMGSVMRNVTPSVSSHKMASVLTLRRIDANAAYPFFREILTTKQISNLLTTKYLPKNAVVQQVRDFTQRDDFRRLPLMSQISINEMQSYMQNVLLRDSDQMSMAHALELRVPFLDVDVVTLALRISDDLKMGEGSKPLLVDSVRDLLPTDVYNRPKMGFVFPFDGWMRNDLKRFCAENLKNLSDMPQFNGDTMLQLWSDFLHKKNGVTWSRLWLLVALAHWLEENGIR
ncbi:MAG: asparagine synthase [Saprospiraceae bacterium]|nr:asparagine synthase [Saprospiraceae bacterium]